MHSRLQTTLIVAAVVTALVPDSKANGQNVTPRTSDDLERRAIERRGPGATEA